MSVMISINPPYTDMIFSGEKWLEFRKRIINSLKPFYGNSLGSRIFIYETKNKGGSGKIIGEARVFCIWNLMYDKADMNDQDLTREKMSCIQTLYYDWCLKKGYQPNPNEGWFKSKRFTEYIEKIGFGSNYAIHLDAILKYDTPLSLSCFINSNGDKIIRPPQNMFYCKRIL